MPTALDVANYFLATLGSDEESDLTHLKMQKLCAYAQGLSLALLDRPLFPEELEAWKHGPVVASLYERFKDNGKLPIPPNGMTELQAREPFDNEQKLILELTREYYGSRTAAILRGMSHEDFPGVFRSKMVISTGKIKESFERLSIVNKLKNFSPRQQSGRAYSEQELFDALRN